MGFRRGAGRSLFLLLLVAILASISLAIADHNVVHSSSNPETRVDDSDGGFPSLEGMLHWAIGHSDSAKLRETVEKLSPSDLNKRQLELEELMERLKVPSDAELMKRAIDELNNGSNPHQALEELLILVEPIDNANNLDKLGGISALISQLDSSDPEVRTSCAWILGKASQNNPLVQNQISKHVGALRKLMNMVKSDLVEEASVKAFYAISALIRNNLDAQDLFYAEAGHSMLQEIMNNSNVDVRLRRKAVYLVGDLVQSQLEEETNELCSHFSNGLFFKSLVDLTALPDLDLKEKALGTIKNVLQMKKTEVTKEFCGLDKALEKMKQDLNAEEDQSEYTMELETLREEVEMILHNKIGANSCDQ